MDWCHTMSDTRTIEVHTPNKTFRVKNIPSDARITYGGTRPDQPGGKTNTLRIYKSGNHQLAVFREVEWFRDLSLEIENVPSPPKKDFIEEWKELGYRGRAA